MTFMTKPLESTELSYLIMHKVQALSDTPLEPQHPFEGCPCCSRSSSQRLTEQDLMVLYPGPRY
jgi:hypothetical protein